MKIRDITPDHQNQGSNLGKRSLDNKGERKRTWLMSKTAPDS